MVGRERLVADYGAFGGAILVADYGAFGRCAFVGTQDPNAKRAVALLYQENLMHPKLLVLFAALLAACAPPPAPDTVALGKALLARDSAWEASASSGNVETIISYWSDDALVIPPGQPPIEGKAALRAYISEMLKIPGFKIDWKSEKPQFSADGKFATLRGTNQVTVPGPDGKPMMILGRGITVWRLDADGQWRCTMDIWNEPPLPVTQPKAK